jgi:hypothetical protein
MTSLTTRPTQVLPELHTTIEQLYVRQLTLLDNAEIARWAAMFTENALFEEAYRDVPLRGRVAIAARAQQRADALAAQGIAFRHWIDMLRVSLPPTGDSRAPGELHTTLYALAMATPRGGSLEVRASVVCRDLLIRRGRGWAVAHRDLRHDRAAEF